MRTEQDRGFVLGTKTASWVAARALATTLKCSRTVLLGGHGPKSEAVGSVPRAAGANAGPMR